MSESEFDELAAALRSDAAETKVFLAALAAKLQDVLGDRVDVERKGGLLRGASRVHAVRVRLGDNRYEIEDVGGEPACRRRTEVRGITLKSEQLAVDEWVAHLAADLREAARSSDRARAALERLLLG